MTKNGSCEPTPYVPKKARLLPKVLLGLGSVLGCLGLIELGVRWFLGDKVEWETRPFEPFFVSGDFYGAMSLEKLARTREGPRAFGYKNAGGIYLHERPKGPWEANGRADFLFDHYLSRYSARDADKLNDSAKRPLRIYVIGGSLAVGSSATTKEKTWHALLEQKLRKELARPNIHVINASMGAFVTSQERMAMEWAVAPREPDMVIVLNGYNDLHTPVSVGVAPGDPLQTGIRYAEAYDTSFLRWVCHHSSLARLLWKARMERRIREYGDRVLADGEESARISKGIVDVYVGNMKWLVRRGKQMGIPVLVFFQPWKSLDDSTVLPGEKPMADFARETASKIRLAMSKLVQNGSFFDLANIQSSLEKHYTDAVHLDDFGQEVLAGEIFSRVLPAFSKR